MLSLAYIMCTSAQEVFQCATKKLGRIDHSTVYRFNQISQLQISPQKHTHNVCASYTFMYFYGTDTAV